jgi:hypothetical protein
MVPVKRITFFVKTNYPAQVLLEVAHEYENLDQTVESVATVEFGIFSGLTGAYFLGFLHPFCSEKIIR